MKPSIYFVTTENCNLTCKHCYLSAGPGKKHTTINEKDFRKVINNLPKIPLDLMLTGGEVFTIKDELYGFLDYISHVNKKRQKNHQGRINTEIQTNGFWATNEKRIENILSELLNFGVNHIDIASNDKYHNKKVRKNGIRLANYLENISLKFSGTGVKEMDELLGINPFGESSIGYSLRGTGINTNELFPIGRAKKLKRNKLRISYWDCKNKLKGYKFNVWPDGKVGSCIWRFFELEGNLTKEPLTKIVKRAKQNKRIKMLNSNGIKSLAIHDGWQRRDVRDLIDVHGECGACYNLYPKQDLMENQ